LLTGTLIPYTLSTLLASISAYYIYAYDAAAYAASAIVGYGSIADVSAVVSATDSTTGSTTGLIDET
jgi:hypothetical protein